MTASCKRDNASHACVAVGVRVGSQSLSAITQFDGLVFRAFDGHAWGDGRPGGTSQFRFPSAVEMPGSGTGSRRLGAGRILIVGGAAISGRRGGSRGRSWRRGRRP
jgi:hypothetical protein